ncbi:MAG TPA: aminotransferase class V-fold PLP-dependent enzyme [Ruminiclostridium sp.]|nr:aminotransferase class V-fold PLP-dependent enzyme [Ruminiclostridium sp.]
MIYLDNAATTYPKPASVAQAVYDFMRDKAANPGRSGHKMSMAAAYEVYACRNAVSELFNAPGPEYVAFTLNATQAINMALKGVLLKNKGHVITSDLEHNAVMRPLYKLNSQGIRVSKAYVNLENDDETIASFESLIESDTVMIACTHASNVCGRILPIKRIGELCKKYGLKFLVDASQTAGIIKIDMKECGINYLCMPGHKSLYGPMGTGILITSGDEALETIIEGGTGSNSVSLAQPDFMPDRMESGTVNAPGIAGLRAGIRFASKVISGGIELNEMDGAAALYKALEKIDGAEIYTPYPDERYVPVISFNIKGMASADLAKILDKHGFALRGGLHCSPSAHEHFGTIDRGMVRASFGAFNTKKDALRLAAAIAQIAKHNPAE